MSRPTPEQVVQWLEATVAGDLPRLLDLVAVTAGDRVLIICRGEDGNAKLSGVLMKSEALVLAERLLEASDPEAMRN